MAPVSQKFLCQVCTADRLEIIDLYAGLPRVTSDCKPWPSGGKMAVCHACGATQKLPDAAWFDDIGRIYKEYEIYKLSSGAEQVIFNGNGSAAPRSQTLVDFIGRSVSLPAQGKLIDIGCGNGGALRTFSSALPAWRLYGTELSDAALPLLKTLPNFVQLFTGEQPEIDERFELVTMIHSLEHMPEPSRTLKEASGLMTDAGMLFVEIPDVETSPFDLVVADHLMHFSRATLRFLAERNGFSVQVLRNDLLPKENTLLASRGGVSAQTPDASAGIALVKRNTAWLRAVIDLATSAANFGRPFGLFGTSISGMWLYGALQDKIEFFVDEDESRIGQKVDGRPIVALKDIPKDSRVFVPLIPAVAKKVIARLAPWKAQFVAPPPLAS